MLGRSPTLKSGENGETNMKKMLKLDSQTAFSLFKRLQMQRKAPNFIVLCIRMD